MDGRLTGWVDNGWMFPPPPIIIELLNIEYMHRCMYVSMHGRIGGLMDAGFLHIR